MLGWRKLRRIYRSKSGVTPNQVTEKEGRLGYQELISLSRNLLDVLLHLRFFWQTGADGEFTDWSLWSDCDVTCGTGKQERSRTCTSPSPQGYGDACAGKRKEARACNEGSCPAGKNLALTVFVRFHSVRNYDPLSVLN